MAYFDVGRTMLDARFCLEIWGTDYNRIKEMCLLADDYA